MKKKPMLFMMALLASLQTYSIMLGSTYESQVVDDGLEDETPCFVPAYDDRVNWVKQPECNDLTGFGGWGTKEVNTNSDFVYCGDKSISVNSPWGGTLEMVNLQPNTCYRFIAKTFVPDGLIAKFSAYKHDYGEGDIDLWYSENTGQWENVDFTFKTSNTASTGIYYVGDKGNGKVYIDNYEVYIVDEPFIRIQYCDEEGNPLKDERIVSGVWGMDVSNYLMIGQEFIATADKQEIEKDGKIYRYDESSHSDRVVLHEGENLLTIRFIEATGPSQNADLSSLSVEGGTLVPDFSPEVTEYQVTLVGTDLGKPIYEKQDELQQVSGAEPVDLTSGSGRSEITVTAEDGETTKTYVINYKVIPSDDSFVPTYQDRENLVTDPFCSDVAQFGGWGTKQVNTDLNYVYNGHTSIAMAAPFRGTLEINDLKPNTAYRFIAQTYATEGVTAQFGWFGHGLGSGDVHFDITTQTGVWQKADFTFKTSEAGGSVFFAGDGGNGYAYIDNYEVYIVEEPWIRIHYVDQEGNVLKEDFRKEGDWLSMDPQRYLMLGHEYVADESDKMSFSVNGVYYVFDEEQSVDHVMLVEGENELTLVFKPLAIPVEFDETDDHINVMQDVYADVLLKRTLKADTWNAFCVPFDISSSQLLELGIVDVQMLTGLTSDNGDVILDFESQGEVVHGMPYLVKVDKDMSQLELRGVMIKASVPNNIVYQNVEMEGMYAKKSLAKGTYGLNDDVFKQVEDVVSQNGFSAYIRYASEDEKPTRLCMRINGIVTSVSDDKVVLMENEFVDVYSLTGILIKKAVRREDALKNLTKGIYIVDNKKVFVSD